MTAIRRTLSNNPSAPNVGAPHTIRVAAMTFSARKRLLVSTVCGAMLAACASSPSSTGATPDAAARRALLLHPEDPAWTTPAPPVSHLRFETTKGVFVVEVIRSLGPIGADRFYNLARLGYYDDTRFHRVNKNYIAQFGIHGDPAVNAAWKTAYIKDDPPHSQNSRGTFAFAVNTAAPNTRTTQVYFNLADNSRNNGEPFTVLGRVVEGMSVLDSLYSGYGESSGSGVRQGRQGPLETGGNAFMDREYPLLDRIIRVTVTTVASPSRSTND
jgi:cyclophilin family peptidyl-prolyl cis-trans isomerase